MPKSVTVQGDAAPKCVALALGPSLALWALYLTSRSVFARHKIGGAHGFFTAPRDFFPHAPWLG